MPVLNIGQVILMIALITVNAFFVAAEMGLTRIRRTRVDQLVEEQNRTARTIQEELNNPDRFIAACQLGITLATLALGATGEQTFASDFAAWIRATGIVPEAALPLAQAMSYILAFSITAFFQTVFGEIVPKVFALDRAEPVLMLLVWPMRAWIWLTQPFLYVINGFTSLVFRVLNIQEPPRRHHVHSGEELRMLVSASHEEGVLEEKEEEMLHSVFDFSDTVVYEVMTPRTDMVCIQAESTVQDFVDLALKHGHSRIPVYEEDIDSIFGAVHIRDGLRALVETKGHTHVRELARKVLIVPENKDAGDLLADLRKAKTHMAIVVDEYGGTRGMVTMEDLIEELVGDIADEHEIVEEYIQKQPDGSWVLDAKVPLDEIEEHLEIKIEDEEFNTLGGHVFGQLGREPKIGDEVKSENYVLRVEEADRHRILKIRLIKLEKAAADHDNNNGSVVPGELHENGSSKTMESRK